MENGALANAETVAWVCFILGAVVVLVGLYLGIVAAPQKAGEETKKKLEEAKAKMEETTAHLERATARGRGDDAAAAEAADATETAKETTEQAKSLLDGIGEAVGSLPEHQRFPGLLVLVGTALMGVATIQFGGTSIF